MSSLGSKEQRKKGKNVSRVHLCPVFDQSLGNLAPAVQRRHVQRSRPVRVRGVHLGPVSRQKLNYLASVILNRNVKRKEPSAVQPIWIYSVLFYKQAHNANMTVLYGNE